MVAVRLERWFVLRTDWLVNTKCLLYDAGSGRSWIHFGVERRVLSLLLLGAKSLFADLPAGLSTGRRLYQRKYRQNSHCSFRWIFGLVSSIQRRREILATFDGSLVRERGDDGRHSGAGPDRRVFASSADRAIEFAAAIDE